MPGYYPGPSSGDATGVLPIANTAGGTVVTDASPFFGEGDIKVVEMATPGEGESAPSVLAVKIAGNASPSIIISSDMHGTGICLGDGTTSPDSQIQLLVTGPGDLRIYAADQIALRAPNIQYVGDPGSTANFTNYSVQSDLRFADGYSAPILPDRTTGTAYRLVVDNGVLGIEAV